MKRNILLGPLACMLIASTASAQVEITGRIVVAVEDQQGSRLPGATVSASASDSVTSREAVTNSVGEATLLAMDPSASYSVVVTMQGFADSRNENVLVRSGHTASLRVTLGLAGVAETVTVTTETPLVDTTSAITGQDVTLELTESLPTGRSYQSYLQLVPGVLPDDPDKPGNPSAKSGLNYSDINGDVGHSADNFYYIDGINITDGNSGTFGANLNTEIIQEQKVLTGGMPAEYVGAPGLMSNVVLKAGSNTFSGSVNYFFQNDSLEAANENLKDQAFSTYDGAFTLGGPIITDKSWFFASYRRINRDDDVVANDTGEFLRTVSNSQDQWYLRGTYSPTAYDTVSFTFLNDPTTISGRREIDISNARDRSRDQGGNRWGVKYSRLLGMNALLNVVFNKHNGELSDFSVIREAENNISFPAGSGFTRADQELGGWGSDIINQRDTKLFSASLDYSPDVHDMKAGVEWKENSNFRNGLTIGADNARWWSLDPSLSGITAGDYVFRAGSSGEIAGAVNFDPSNASDYGGLIRTIDSRPDRAAFYNAYDSNGDGTITQEELAANMVFNSTAGNPHGRVNYDRFAQTAAGEQFTKNRGLTFYVQDSFRAGNFVFNAGLRIENWRYFNTLGEKTSFFEWTFAPRISAVYDIKGDARQKLSAFWGRYYDPIRNNMTNFAGSVSGRVREEQVWANAVGDWVTYRVRGGPVQPDALFAPTTKTPYTDDLQVGYEIDLGNSTSFEVLYTNRRTRQILEDYDLALYAFATDGSTLYLGPIDHPDSLFLGLDYFGYTENPGSNFVIATLAGGKRDYQGLELTFRKRFTGNWQALVSYNYNDAKGNTNSDSNADFQGDVIWLDPRAPNQFGDQPGLIRHLFKGAVTYQFDMGLELGTGFTANNGFLLSRTFLASRRHLPIRDTQNTTFAGITRRWLEPGAVGGVDNPSWAQLDLRIQYIARFQGNMRAEFFVDIFNVLNSQVAFRNQDLVAGGGGIDFGEATNWRRPRRMFLGVRFNF